MDRRLFLKGFFGSTLAATAMPSFLAAFTAPAEAAVEPKAALARVHENRLLAEILKKFEDTREHLVFGQYNDQLLRRTVSAYCNAFMQEFKSRGVIYDFLIVCDERNNPPDLIDSNGFGLLAAFKLGPTVKTFTIEFT